MNSNQPSMLRRFLAWSFICACGAIVFIGAIFVAADKGLLPASAIDALESTVGSDDCG